MIKIKEQITIEKVMKNLIGIKTGELFHNNVICAFEDYDFNGVSEIIISECNNNIYNYLAYANHSNSP